MWFKKKKVILTEGKTQGAMRSHAFGESEAPIIPPSPVPKNNLMLGSWIEKYKKDHDGQIPGLIECWWASKEFYEKNVK